MRHVTEEALPQCEVEAPLNSNVRTFLFARNRLIAFQHLNTFDRRASFLCLSTNLLPVLDSSRRQISKPSAAKTVTSSEGFDIEHVRMIHLYPISF